jgi:integrase
MSSFEVEVDRFLSTRWGWRMLHEITRQECRELHDAITADNGPYAANRVMRHLRALWNTALKECDLPGEPDVAVHWNQEERRQEPIPWERLPAWRVELDKLGEVRRDYNLVVLFTGLRRMDAATIRREHVNLKERTLLRPNPKGGKKRAFTIPISEACLRYSRARFANNYILNKVDDGWVFPTDSLKDRVCVTCRALGLPDHKAGTRTHMSEPKVQRISQKKGEKAVVTRNTVLVSPHRLRDTYTTALAALDPKVSGYVIDVLTNHAPPRGSVTAGYINLATEDLRSAQERVSQFLLAKMQPKKQRASKVRPKR